MKISNSIYIFASLAFVCCLVLLYIYICTNTICFGLPIISTYAGTDPDLGLLGLLHADGHDGEAHLRDPEVVDNPCHGCKRRFQQ